MKDGLRRLWTRVFGDTLHRIDEDAAAFVASAEGRSLDRRLVWLLITAAVCLVFREYLGDRDMIRDWVQLGRSAGLLDGTGRIRVSQIDQYTYWAIIRIIGYFVIPAVVIRLVLRGRLRDYGGRLRGAFSSFGVYGAVLGIALLLVLLVSGTDSFMAKYPFYDPPEGKPFWPDLYRWELLYALQFVATEFFYRGFLVHGMKHRFGTYSVLIAMIPYVMVHFGKPLPETLAAVVAGIVLGLMSLKTGAMWMGALLHVIVAWSMDVAALWHEGMIP